MGLDEVGGEAHTGGVGGEAAGDVVAGEEGSRRKNPQGTVGVVGLGVRQVGAKQGRGARVVTVIGAVEHVEAGPELEGVTFGST